MEVCFGARACVRVYTVDRFGMAGVNYRQDMPPKGGYDAFRFSRHLPKRGPNGTVVMLGGVAVMAFGFYVIKKTNEERRCAYT